MTAFCKRGRCTSRQNQPSKSGRGPVGGQSGTGKHTGKTMNQLAKKKGKAASHAAGARRAELKRAEAEAGVKVRIPLSGSTMPCEEPFPLWLGPRTWGTDWVCNSLPAMMSQAKHAEQPWSTERDCSLPGLQGA
jgi:hypothetical protein